MAAVTSAIMAGVSLGQGYSQAEDLRAQGAQQREQYDFNARVADFQGDQAIRRGDSEANAVRNRGKQVEGAQRVAAAEQGVDVNSGTAADIQNETKSAVAQDVITTKNNAWREAWGLKVQAATYGAQGQQAQAAANNNARNTLIAGGLSALDYAGRSYSRSRQPKYSGVEEGG